MHSCGSGPRRRQAAAFVLATTGHLALLAGLMRPAPEPPLPQAAPLLVTLAGEGGGTPSAAPSRTPETGESERPSEPVHAAPPPSIATVAEAEAVNAEPLQDSLEPPLSPEAIAMAALEPQFDREPDPAVTGDAAGAISAGIPGLPPGIDCPVAGILVQALEGDLAVRTALARIPQSSRSVANAVLLWDGRWADPGRVGGTATIETVRQALAHGLANASWECREQVILGPVFLPVSNGSGTLVLALGSGAWRWRDLLSDPTVPGPLSDLRGPM